MKHESQEVRKERNFYYGVAAGQLASLLAAVTGTLMELLGEDSKPMFVATCTYILLGIFFGSWILREQGWQLKAAWWKYACLVVVDVAAYYFALLAFRFTSITSYTLIQPCSFLTVVPLSILLLHASYTWKHLLSGIVAFAGLTTLLLSDVHGDSSSEDRSTDMIIKGDFFAFLGTSLYGTSAVLVECFIKGDVPQYEVMGMIGTFGSLYGTIASFALGELSSNVFHKALYKFSASAANFGVYSMALIVLNHAGAATLQISFLATNFWSVLSKLFIIGGFHTHIVGFVFAFIMIIAGVTLFTLAGDPYAKRGTTYTPLDTELPSHSTVQPSNVT